MSAWRRSGGFSRHSYGCLLVVVMSLLAGCASGPRDGAPGRSSSARPGDTVRDGPPERPPADLVKVPNAEPRVEPIRRGGPNKPYVVLGRGYEPLADDVPFKQRGTASWYGAKFHGRRTASGEVYSMYGMTAAHRTLPIPSYARVRELRSGQEIIVRINDRGPFHGGRVLDLSYTAALKLGAVARGSVEVEIERLTFEDIRSGRWRSGDEPETRLATDSPPVQASVPPGQLPALDVAPPPEAVALTAEADPILALASRLEEARPAQGMADADAAAHEPAPERRAMAFTPASKGYWVQLAAFRQRQGVDEFQKRVAREIEHLAPLLAVYQEGVLYRLQAGPYDDRDQAQDLARRLREVLQLEPVVVNRR